MEGNPSTTLELTEPRQTIADVLAGWLRVWSRLYRRELVDEDFAIYGELLKDLTPDQLDQACRAASERCTFFPTPAEIRAQIDQANAGGLQIEAAAQWQKVLEYVRKYYLPDMGLAREAPSLGPAIEHAVNAAGGLRWIESCPPKELPWARRRFLEAFTRLHQTQEVRHLLTRGEARKVLAGLTARTAEQNARLLAPPAAPGDQSDAPSNSRPENSGPPKAIIPKFEPLPPTEGVIHAPAVVPPCSVAKKPEIPPVELSEEEWQRRKDKQKLRLEKYLSRKANGEVLCV